MTTNIKDLSNGKVELQHIDVCILGGGVAGLVLANELKDTNLKVLVVDSGNEGYVQNTQDLYSSSGNITEFPDPLYSRLRFLGGSSNHWQNNTSPLSPIDFEKRSWVENSGWPIGYEDINAYYAGAQKYCGVASDGYDVEHWEKTLKEDDLASSSLIIESQMAKMAFPPVRFFSSLKSELLSSNNIEFLVNANLVDITYEKQTEEVSSVKVVSLNGQNLEITADKFVLSLGGLENARLLLHFNEKYDNRIGNQSGCVGKYLMEHPTPRAAIIYPNSDINFDFYSMSMEQNRAIVSFFSLTEEALKENKCSNLRVPLIPATEYEISEGISSGHILANSIRDLEAPDDVSSHLKNVITDIDMVLEGIARKVFDKKLFDSADEVGGYLCPIMIEQSPDETNMVYLSEDKDALGLKKISIEYKLSEKDKENTWKALEVMSKGFGESGIGRIRMLKERASRMWGDQLGFSNHHMGTTRMSESHETGVVNENLKVHGCGNLYVGGSSIFCTGGHIPPTLTICAFSIRLAEHLKLQASSS